MFLPPTLTLPLKGGGNMRGLLPPPLKPDNPPDRLAVEPSEAAVAGCAALYHVAADYRLWVRDPAAMHRANVDGTRQLMEAALAAGVERVVYTSSVATLGLTADGSPADETTPSRLEDMIGPY